MKKGSLLTLLAGAAVGLGLLCLHFRPAQPEPPALRELAWSQTAMSSSEFFLFTLGRSQEDRQLEGHFLNCEFQSAEGEWIQRQDAPLSDGQWAELEALLRELTLSPYVPPDEGLLDAGDSRITVRWEGGGKPAEVHYGRNGAGPLYAYLCALAMQARSMIE